MTETIGMPSRADSLGFGTAIIGTRYGPRAKWGRNSLLARRQREAEERFRLDPRRLSPAPMSGTPAVIAHTIPTSRSILGFVGDHHWVVALFTRFAYLFESATSFRSH